MLLRGTGWSSLMADARRGTLYQLHSDAALGQPLQALLAHDLTISFGHWPEPTRPHGDLSELHLIDQLEAEVGVSPLAPHADVALVDDDPLIGALVKRVVTKLGYSLTWFEDGLAAVAALCQPRTVQVKLILLDVSMPGLDGFGVLHYLQRDGVLEQSNVIMLTASASEQDVRRAIGLGAIGYLAKPLNIALLTARIQRSLS
jgi:CheY-like chemotaxis protein